MAKKEPPVEEEPQEELNYNDIHGKSIRDVAAEELQDKPEEKQEEKPEEELSLDEVGKKIAQESAEEAAKRVLEQQKQEEEAQKAKVEEERKAKESQSDEEKAYEAWREKFEKDKNRQPTYLEALEFVGKQVEKSIEAKQQQRILEQQEAQKKTLEQQEQDRQRINAVVDDEMSVLYEANLLPKPREGEDKMNQDLRKDFYRQWAEVNQKRVAEGKPEIISATRIYHYHYKKPNNQAGVDAPIAGSQSPGTPPAGEQEIDYREIHGKPFRWFGK